MEVIALRTGYRAANDAADEGPETVAAAPGPDVGRTRSFLARLGGFSPRS